ncbi:hypothetical protein EAG_14421 [Camponotus floridanus]|uniref:Uncharacterized protein n=1 Tax=Camponotus floridanus TaxID=104421 RepID=E2A4Z5_CAMFO|nr:hypothetical protein EAG_14421 [Camponotus floridanus]
MAAKRSTSALLATHGGGLSETESIFALLILSGCLFPTSAGDYQARVSHICLPTDEPSDRVAQLAATTCVLPFEPLLPYSMI